MCLVFQLKYVSNRQHNIITFNFIHHTATLLATPKIFQNTHLVQLLRIVTGNQEKDIRTDILGHGIVMANDLTIIDQEFRIWHKFGYSKNSCCSLQHIHTDRLLSTFLEDTYSEKI